MGPVELTLAGIPYCRSGRDELRAEVERADDEDHALALLLTDRDDWASGPGPTVEDARRALQAETLRDAMDALRYGPVADYFAFRWSDPTYLSALALLDAHSGGVDRVFELGCGIGHLLREGAQRQIAVTGADVVFSKLWLCRRFVCPEAELVCFDAADPFPVAEDFDLALCHDALHYLPGKEHVVSELRRLAPRVVLGHVHNGAVENLSPGAALDVAGYAALLHHPRGFDDRELAQALLTSGARAPERTPDELARSPAVAFVEGATAPVEPERSFATPVGDLDLLRPNPLLRDGLIRWPSPRYATEYGPDSAYLTAPAPAEHEELVRRRLLLDLPEAW